MSVITIKGEVFEKIYKANKGSAEPFAWGDFPHQIRNSDSKQVPKDVLENYHRIDLSKYSKDDLLEMIDVLKKIDSKLKSITTIQNWLQILKDPINAPIQTLESLLKLIDEIVSKNPLFFIKNEDGSSMPIKVVKTEKLHDREEGESYVRIEYSFLRIKIKKRSWYGNDEDNSPIARLEEFKNSIYIYKTSILKSGEDLFDDSAEKKTLLEILLSKSIIPYDEELMQLYKVSLENFISYTRKVGQQFYLKGKAITSSSWWYSDTSFRDVDTQIIIEEIDDAILSRCTIHIQYTYPTKENAIKIFKNLSKVNKFAIEDKDIEAILDQYEKISGRSIGVIVKNLKMLSEMKGEKPTVSLFKTIKNFIYIHEA